MIINANIKEKAKVGVAFPIKTNFNANFFW